MTEKHEDTKPAPDVCASVRPPAIAALGASAGGLDALTRFFDATEPDSGLAYIVVLHLDPTRESQIASILGRHTTMPVCEIEDGMPVETGHVYVIAPSQYIQLEGATLRLTEPTEPRGRRHPIDVLFRSLADQGQERIIGIVLSGTGTNGTQGLKDIKAYGGLIMVQEPASAQFNGMPRSAIATGLADYVLAPDDMPAVLRDYMRQGYVQAPDALAINSLDAQTGLEQVVGILRIHSGEDFRNYKPAMLARRVNRRMGLKNLEHIEAYLKLLRNDTTEIHALVKDLLISVTGFFRDEDAWEALDKLVITPLIANRASGSSIRVWIPACATAEEVYSLAMLLVERAEAEQKHFEFSIFASDLQDDNLNVARDAVYPGSSVEMLTAPRIRRYFEKLDGSYQIKKELRDLVIFARHDLLRDPPFSRVDIVSCRNLFIYLEPEAQKRALALVHFALREGGTLFLGNAETVGQADDLFDVVSKKWRIYRRVGPTRRDIVGFPALGASRRASRIEERVPAPLEPVNRGTEVARRLLLDRYAPASVLVDQKGRIVYFHGQTGDYLTQPTGAPTRDLLLMAREGLHARLRGALHHAAAQGGMATHFTAQVRQADAIASVLVTLVPVSSPHLAPGSVLITFEPKPVAEATAPAVTASGVQENPSEVLILREELRSTRMELQNTIEQLEGVNEELKAANEEATSMNEELQSTNEELETSKEELQSFNEELNTVNVQLSYKAQEAESGRNDLANLLAGSEIATVFLDREFRIKWFSPATKPLFDFVSSDVGRPFSHFSGKFSDTNLMSDAEHALAELTRIEAEIQNDAGKWFSRRIIPYRTLDSRIAGLVITFMDITDRKRASNAVNEARIYAEAIVSTTRQPLLILSGTLVAQSANEAFYQAFQTNREQVEGKAIEELGGGFLHDSLLAARLKDLLPNNAQIRDMELEIEWPGNGNRTLLLNARALSRDVQREDLILLAFEEITERHRNTRQQEILISELSHRVKNTLATVQAIMSQTARGSVSLKEFSDVFEGRLHALAIAHSLLIEKNWLGTDLKHIAEQTLAPYRSQEGDRIVAHGPRLIVVPEASVQVVMVFHELATNAAKYGALSTSQGKLDISWSVREHAGMSVVLLEWQESGGPTVTPPCAQGFGTKLIERSLTAELHGGAVFAYQPEGLRCELRIPLTSFRSSDGEGRE